MTSVILDIFTNNECEEILNNDDKEIFLVKKCKDMMNDYLNSHNLHLNNVKISTVYSRGSSGVNNGAKKWHFDDTIIVNFILCLEGEGTLIYNDETKKIGQLKKGQGVFVIGELGYAFLGILPTFHRAPNFVSKERMLFKYIIEGDFDLNQNIIGDVEEYGIEIFKKRYQETILWKKKLTEQLSNI